MVMACSEGDCPHTVLLAGALYLLWKMPYSLATELVSSRRPEKEHYTELMHTLYTYICNIYMP
jgi:hypothetical protein